MYNKTYLLTPLPYCWDVVLRFRLTTFFTHNIKWYQSNLVPDPTFGIQRGFVRCRPSSTATAFPLYSARCGCQERIVWRRFETITTIRNFSPAIKDLSFLKAFRRRLSYCSTSSCSPRRQGENRRYGTGFGVTHRELRPFYRNQR
jgi:hypothetical protein